MSLAQSRSGIFVGRNAGHAVTRPATLSWRQRPVTTKGKISKRSKAIREIVREIAGFSPLESKMDELLKMGEAAKDKKAVKLARAKLGTHRRALVKKTEIQALIAAAKKRKD